MSRLTRSEDKLCIEGVLRDVEGDCFLLVGCSSHARRFR